MGPIFSIRRPDQVTRPLDQFILKADTVVKLGYLYENMASKCYASKAPGSSFKWVGSVEESTQIDIENFVIRSTLWGFFDPSAARRLGYHYPAPGPSLEGVKYGPISEAQVTECIRSLDEAFPGGRSWEGLIGTGGLPGGGPASRIEDSRYLAAAAKWSACMKIRGFAAQQPLQLLSDPRWNTPAPTPEEIATATADVDCKIETNLVGVAVAVLKAYDNEYIAKHLTELNAFGPMIDKFIRDHQ